MTHYDKLIDAMVQTLYESYHQENWSEDQAIIDANDLLRMVEEFQTNRSKVKSQWRASD
jgi:hypothetical protein